MKIKTFGLEKSRVAAISGPPCGVLASATARVASAIGSITLLHSCETAGDPGILLIAVALTIGSCLVSGQAAAINGQIEGTLTDPAGAAVAGARVTADN